VIVTPSTFMTIEEILVVIAIVAGAAWYLSRRLRSGAETGRPAPKYHPFFVLIHWFVAFAIANLLLRGALIMRYIPNSDPEKVDGLRAHMYAGTLVLVLMLIRLVVRRKTQLPPRATARNRNLDWLAKASHRLLYVLVLGQALSGLTMAVQTGLPDALILGRGTLPEDFWVFSIRSVHYLISRLLMATIALHLAGAMYHTFILRDGLLRRMSFGRRAMAHETTIEGAHAAGAAQPANAGQRV
jgi:cytochrome b561